MQIKSGTKLDYSDILIEPQKSVVDSRSRVNLARTFFEDDPVRKFTCTPLIAANMDTVATFEMGIALGEMGCLTAIHKHYSLEELIVYFKCNSQFSFYSMGNNVSDYAKFSEFKKHYTGIHPLKLCLDVANGYNTKFIDFVERMRHENPDAVIMAGNVATPEGVEHIIEAGANIVKVGIGSGSGCLTREVAGVGFPQFSCVVECAQVADAMGGLLCSDGGCTVPGDVAKSFGAGADFVMLGGMLGGHDESGGDVVEFDGKKFKQFYGMSSETAMVKHSGGVAEYKASEGRSLMLPYRGAVMDTMNRILGGVRSACTYSNAENLIELHQRISFIRVNNQLNTVYSHHEI